MLQAEELVEAFRVEVLDVVAYSESAENEKHGPGVKGVVRSREKARLEYGGDARQLKDVLRCSIICVTMAALCVCCSRVAQ